VAGDLVALLPNVPNPFNPATEIRFTLGAAMPVRLSVHALTGRRVAVLADRVFAAGDQAVIWRGLDARGQPVPSGRYAAVLEAAGMRVSRGLTLLR
jgi:type IV secretory pathway protease TraF